MIVPDEIHRSARKTLSISVDATGRLIVRAPLRCSEARIIAFIEKKSDWITLRQERAKSVRALLPSKDLDGFKFSLQGRVCVVRKANVKRMVFDEENYVLWLPQDGDEKAIVRWLKRRAKAVFTNLADIRSTEMQAQYNTLSVSSAKRR
jgi:predicted metal-dependent hydrolase